MRYAIVFSMICSSAIAGGKATSTNSLDSFARQMRHSYEQKDEEWLLKNFCADGVPAEILATERQIFRSVWRAENLKVTSVKTFRSKNYKSTSGAGEIRGRKLRFVDNPTHWIVLKAESSKPKDRKVKGGWTQIELSLPVLEKDGRWRIAGATYAG